MLFLVDVPAEHLTREDIEHAVVEHLNSHEDVYGVINGIVSARPVKEKDLSDWIHDGTL